MKGTIEKLTADGARIAAGLPCMEKEIDPKNLLKFYNKNKYPLLAFAAGRNGHDFFKSDELLSARESQENIFNSFRQEYLEVRKRWLEKGIPCLLLKSGGPFPAFPYTSDNMDILIPVEHEDTAREVLGQLGFVELKNLEEPQKFLFRKFRGGALALDIHLHTRIGWGVNFIDGNDAWKDARVSPDDEAVIIPSPENTILITLAHSFYENKKIRLADLLRVTACFQNGVDWQYMKNTAEKGGWYDGLCFSIALCAELEKSILGNTSVPSHIIDECLVEMKKSSLINRYFSRLRQRTCISLPFFVSFVFSKLVFYKKILRDRRDTLPRRLYHVIRTLVWGIKLKTNFYPQASFLISFSGVDGSGKSSHAELLKKCLSHYGLRVNYRWSRGGTSGVTRLLSVLGQALFWRQSHKNDQQPSASRRQKRLNNPLLRFLWTYTMAADLIFSNFIKATVPLWLGKIVICDRYIYDAVAEMESSLAVIEPWNKLAISLVLKLASKPDIAFVMDVPHDVSMARRDDNTDIALLERQRNAYAVMARKHQLHTINTERKFENNFDEILIDTARLYYEQFPTFMNWLLFSNPGQLNPRMS